MKKLTIDDFFMNKTHIYCDYDELLNSTSNELSEIINNMNIFTRYIFLYKNVHYEVYIENKFDVQIVVREMYK